MPRITISDQLADLIGTPRGTTFADDHGSFVGQHVYITPENGTMKVVVDPLDRQIPAEFQAKNYHHPLRTGSVAVQNDAINALMSAAVAFTKATGN